MKRETIVIGLLVMFVGAGISVAADSDIGVSLDATWVSKYLWRGVDVLDDKAAFQPSVNFDIGGSGLSFNVWASYGCASDTVNATEYDYSLIYSNSINEGLASEIVYAASWVYYDFIDQPSSLADAQEINLSIAMPNICAGGVIPSYTIIKMWAAESNSASSSRSGWIHVVSLDYALPVEGFILGNNPEQVIDLSWDMVYNGSAGVAGTFNADGTVTDSDVDHDWSHMTFGASTAIELPGAGTITPGIYYQVSMDDSVNTEDEIWTGLSYTINF